MSTEHNDNLNKIYSELKKIGEIKECFYHNPSECDGSIKNAHSISRGNRLDLIKGVVNKNDQVYSLSEVIIENGVVRRGIKAVGWGKAASTFYGFCDKHDTELFKPIENGNDFDNSSGHCFLHSYRSFAYTYHGLKKTHKLTNYAIEYISKLKEQAPIDELIQKRDALVQAMNKIESQNIPFPKEELLKQFKEKLLPKIENTFNPFGETKTHAAVIQAQASLNNVNSFSDIIKLYDTLLIQFDRLNSLVIEGRWKLTASKKELDAKGLHSWLEWMNDYKKKLDYMVENKVYDGLKYYCRVKDNLFPFACAFAFSPDFLYSGMDNYFIPPSEPNKVLNSCLMVTVLPDKSNKTIILFSCFNEDKQSVYFLNKLFSLKNEDEFERAVTSIIISRPSNVFLSPIIWDKLGSRQGTLENEINIERPTDELPEKPFMSKLNFFNDEFSGK